MTDSFFLNSAFLCLGIFFFTFNIDFSTQILFLDFFFISKGNQGHKLNAKFIYPDKVKHTYEIKTMVNFIPELRFERKKKRAVKVPCPTKE